ncbi:glycosyltransferase family 2 protein [Pedobacter heparinus]|uniref:glycosyltransferase family 2 protein n=1 Tax=Pedobacter heparinus TaxID=984 RepID=UPI00293019BE|nr:glycosyltransferase family 2 protein [Pedobacter heparinus]
MLDKYPKITVVTPSYNQGAFLEDTIVSVLGQQYPNLEYIIIDGGSTDNSVQIIKKYEQQLAYWVSEIDNGLYDAVQKGFARSTGEIMCWINSDDMHHRKSLVTVAELFASLPGINWIMGANTFYDEAGKMFIPDPDMFYHRWSKWRMYDLDGRFIQQESVFWRRSLWEKAGGYVDRDLSLAGDADLWLRFFRHERLYTTTFMLSGFRVRRSQKSKDNFKEYVDELKMLVKRELKLGNAGYYLSFMRIIRFIAKLIPIQKLKHRLIYRVMGITPKLTYSPGTGYDFDHKYKL